jgi:hypothetical protein
VFVLSVWLWSTVSAWEDKLLPVLDQQYERPQFDIHECSAQLLDTLALEVAENVAVLAKEKEDEGDGEKEGEKEGTFDDDEDEDAEAEEGHGGSKVSPATEDAMAPQFVQLALKQRSSRYEVCRLFLSMLQLANDRNVELTHDTIGTLPERVLQGRNNVVVVVVWCGAGFVYCTKGFRRLTCFLCFIFSFLLLTTTTNDSDEHEQ